MRGWRLGAKTVKIMLSEHAKGPLSSLNPWINQLEPRNQVVFAKHVSESPQPVFEDVALPLGVSFELTFGYTC